MKTSNFTQAKVLRLQQALVQIEARINSTARTLPNPTRFISEEEFSARKNRAIAEKKIVEERISNPKSTLTKKKAAGRIKPNARNSR